MRRKTSSTIVIASGRNSPLLSITHSARWAITMSLISAREGVPFFTKLSSTWVAQMTGISRLGQPEKLLLELGKPLKTDLNRQVTPRDHDADRRPTRSRYDETGHVMDRLSRFRSSR